MDDLVAQRTDMGMTTNKAAKAMGLHRNVLQKAEEGGRISPRSAKKIADFYGYRVSDIWRPDDLRQERAV
jgi:DNA-binding XRE family transcriptional regulator